jgi:hypothetical protein
VGRGKRCKVERKLQLKRLGKGSELHECTVRRESEEGE